MPSCLIESFLFNNRIFLLCGGKQCLKRLWKALRIAYPLRTEPSHTYLMWCHLSCWFYTANITGAMELQTTINSDMCRTAHTHSEMSPKILYIWTTDAHFTMDDWLDKAVQVAFISKKDSTLLPGKTSLVDNVRQGFISNIFLGHRGIWGSCSCIAMHYVGA